MSEYIAREALEVALNHRLSFLMAENSEYDHYTCGYDEAVTTVENFPSADVPEVVRCKDCKHGELYARNDGETGVYCNCSNSIFKYANEHTFTPVRDVDDFCSHGVQKEATSTDE